ncbi:MAG: LysR family transcriptional regulator substrate-binding protein, partial [Actinoplanes sp.]
DLPGTLAGFHLRFPGVELSLRSGLIAGLLSELDAGTVDLVIGPVHDDQAQRFSARVLVREKMMLIVPPGHRLDRAGPLPFADLRDEPFVCLPASSGVRASLDEAAGRAGFTARVPFETHSPASVRELVGAGLGVALQARSAAVTPGPAVVVRTLEPPPAHPPIGLIRRRDQRLSAAARAFRAVAYSPGGHVVDTRG